MEVGDYVVRYANRAFGHRRRCSRKRLVEVVRGQFARAPPSAVPCASVGAMFMRAGASDYLRPPPNDSDKPGTLRLASLCFLVSHFNMGGSVAEWLACWTQAQ